MSLGGIPAGERRRGERASEALPFVDELTGLHDRRGFRSLASRHLALAAREDRAIVLVLVDLEGLAQINETFGRANGDRALVELAGALRRSFGDADVIGRIGGDAFAVLASETDPGAADVAMERLVRRVADRNAEGDLPWTLGASIGWLRVNAADAGDFDALLSRAGARMYERRRPRPAVPAPPGHPVAA